MSIDRFQLLLNLLHFNDNEVIDRQNKLHKIQQLIDSLFESCRSVYTPGSSVVIDEAHVPYREIVIIRQYIPGKAYKYTIKLYKLCTHNSYTRNFLVYSVKMV
ncbi:PiggyBac transposable element-derived protein 4 [Dictyocoela muelleri]|nr:PiggyBac transposable element-derived protein 4 [Dictyocoela muelleri]